MTRSYAEGTSVPSDRSRADIERVLRQHGATSFMYATHEDLAVLGFVLYSRQVRFTLRLPDPGEDRFRLTPGRGTVRARDAQLRAWEAECRRTWRALHLVIKAKLTAVAEGIVEFDREFLAHLVVPGGRTVYEEVSPRLAAVLDSGNAADLLPLAITGGPS